ncbi:MAG: tetratricopeptide repeat protein [Caldilineaceae bacterium]|nr:tetratricopeptide repeat protein [Caldilineaceae bacterium]
MNPKIAIVILLGALLLTACGPAPEEKLEAGNLAFAEEDYATALEQYQQAQSEEPTRAEPLYNMANVFYRQGDYGQSQQTLESALQQAEPQLAGHGAYNLATLPTTARSLKRRSLRTKMPCAATPPTPTPNTTWNWRCNSFNRMSSNKSRNSKSRNSKSRNNKSRNNKSSKSSKSSKSKNSSNRSKVRSSRIRSRSKMILNPATNLSSSPIRSPTKARRRSKIHPAMAKISSNSLSRPAIRAMSRRTSRAMSQAVSSPIKSRRTRATPSPMLAINPMSNSPTHKKAMAAAARLAKRRQSSPSLTSPARSSRPRV